MPDYDYIMWLGEIHEILLDKYHYQIAELLTENPELAKRFGSIFETAYFSGILPDDVATAVYEKVSIERA